MFTDHYVIVVIIRKYIFFNCEVLEFVRETEQRLKSLYFNLLKRENIIEIKIKTHISLFVMRTIGRGMGDGYFYFFLYVFVDFK